MKKIPDNFIDLTVTSPPYDNLRQYNGYDFKFEEIAAELYRITKNGGTLVWVVADETIKTGNRKGSESGNSFRQALYFMDLGFLLYDTMIYCKSNPLPRQHKRYEQAFEYMFVLSKSQPKTTNIRRVPCKQAGTIQRGSARDSGKDTLVKHVKQTNNTKLDVNIWEYFVGARKTSSDRSAKNHPAVFPEDLAKDHILSWSNEGDLVFDPMCGSGTTCKMAKLLNRRYIGCDISGEYVEIANQRIESLSQQA